MGRHLERENGEIGDAQVAGAVHLRQKSMSTIRHEDSLKLHFELRVDHTAHVPGKHGCGAARVCSSCQLGSTTSAGAEAKPRTPICAEGLLEEAYEGPTISTCSLLSPAGRTR
jgi:hypothetical protein